MVSMTDSASITGNGTNLITVKDEQTSIQIHKIDNEINENLAGAKLAIYKASDMDKEVVSWISDEKDKTITGLVTNTEYVLKEIQSVSGYDSFKPIHFTIASDGTLTGFEKNTITAINTRIRAPFEIKKTAKESSGIVFGITFDLYTSEGKKLASGLTTDKDGIFKSENFEGLKDGLPTGSYYVKETKASKNTSLNENKYEFSIGDSDTKANGKLQVIKVTNEMFSSSLSLKKIDATSKEGISKVSFNLMQDGKTIATKTTGEDGTCTFTGLVKGTYTIEELPTTGYKDGNSLYKADFTVTEADNGKTIQVNNDKRFTVRFGSSNADGILNTRRKGSVRLMKQSEDGKPLNKVTFVLKKVKENRSFIDFITGNKYEVVDNIEGTKVEKAEDGVLEIHGLEWGDYVLEETNPANGYVNTDKKGNPIQVTFTIDRDHIDDQVLKIGEDEIKNHVVTNKENTVTLVKQNTSKEGLNGANFSLKVETDQSEKTIHLDGSSLELKGQLTSGHTYSLKEVEAPKGYALIEDDFQFTEDKAGKLAITKGNMAYQLEGTTITVTDPSIDLTFEKLVLDKPQDGAVYKIRGEFADGSKEMTWTSEKAGTQWKALFIGGQSYQLEEVQAPSGSIRNTEKLTITVHKDGSVTSESKDATFKDGLVSITDQPTKVTIRKVDPQDQVVKGAKLQVLDSASKVVDEWTTDQDDHVLIGKCSVGQTYTLHEVQAPSGYVKAEDVSFTVKEDGIMEVKMVDKPEEKASKKKDDTDTGVQTGTMFYVQTGLISLLAAYFLMESQRRKRK